MIPKWVYESPWAIIILTLLGLAIVGVIVESCNR